MVHSYVSLDTSETNLIARRLDLLFWSARLSESKPLRDVLKTRVQRLIAADLFLALYKPAPVVKESPPDPALAQWLKLGLEHGALDSLRERTVLDAHIAAAGAIKLYRELLRRHESVFKALEQVEQNKASVEALGGGEAALQAITQVQESLAQSIDAGDLGADSSVDETNDTLEALGEVASFGLGGDPSQHVLASLLDERIVRYVTEQDRLKRVLQVAGRARMVLEGERAKSIESAVSPIGLTYGDDLGALVPQELALLDDDTEDLFWQRYLEHGLLLYKREDKRKLGRGPLIVCLDMSGSMRGQPEIYALGAFVALAREMLREKRKVCLLPFASYAGRPHWVSDPESLLAALNDTQRVGDGTDFDAVLHAALDTQANEQRSDVMLITDGYGRLGTWYAGAKKATASRLFGLSVSGGWTTDLLSVMDAHTEMERGDLGNLTWLAQAYHAMRN